MGFLSQWNGRPSVGFERCKRCIGDDNPREFPAGSFPENVRPLTMRRYHQIHFARGRAICTSEFKTGA